MPRWLILTLGVAFGLLLGLATQLIVPAVIAPVALYILVKMLMRRDRRRRRASPPTPVGSD